EPDQPTQDRNQGHHPQDRPANQERHHPGARGPQQRPAQDPGAGPVAQGIEQPNAASSPRPSGIPTRVTNAPTARMGRPKNTSSPQPIAGPALLRPASSIARAPHTTI